MIMSTHSSHVTWRMAMHGEVWKVGNGFGTKAILYL
jgi:hypothetical protein